MTEKAGKKQITQCTSNCQWISAEILNHSPAPTTSDKRQELMVPQIYPIGLHSCMQHMQDYSALASPL